MEILDIILLLFLFLLAYKGYRKGLIAAVIYWVGLISAVILIAKFSPLVRLGLINKFHLGIITSTLLSYILIFVLIMLLGKILALLLDKLVHMVKLSQLNRILGSLMGILNGFLVIMILLLLLDMMPFVKPIQRWANSSKVVVATRVLMEDMRVNVFHKINPEKNTGKHKAKKVI